MKNFIILLLCLSVGQALADDFTITPLEKDVDLSSIDKNIKIRSAKSTFRPEYLRPEERDKILSKYIPKKMKSLDQSERDLLYKSILNYDDDTLIKKYSFLKKVKIMELRNALN